MFEVVTGTAHGHGSGCLSITCPVFSKYEHVHRPYRCWPPATQRLTLTLMLVSTGFHMGRRMLASRATTTLKRCCTGICWLVVHAANRLSDPFRINDYAPELPTCVLSSVSGCEAMQWRVM